jgi:hypothetical protein
MKVIVSTALSVFTLAVVLQVQGIATAPTDGLPLPPSPTAPELWNSWGEAAIDGLVWSLRPVACADGTSTALCVEVTMRNPNDAVATGRTQVRLSGIDGSPMARMQPPPNQLEAQLVVLQAGPGGTASTVLTYRLPAEVPSQLNLTIGGEEGDPWSGHTLAAFAHFDLGSPALGLIF